nr:DUF456 domain-containing protein [Bacteroides sp.]
MPQQPTLISIFEKTKDELAASLSGLKLPTDLEKVQNIIASYLNDVCDENSDFRQNLTQSEDYILQAAMSMLNAQRALVTAFECNPQPALSVKAAQPQNSPRLESKASVSASTSFLSAGGGALVGKLLLGGWGAVFGAVAGTAIALYLSQNTRTASVPTERCELETESYDMDTENNHPESETPINTQALLSVIAQICDSLDNLIATFRAQIQRVVSKYESQDKPTIERDFRTLLEGIQSLVGYKRGHSPQEEKYLSKLQTRVEDLAELLDTYDLEAVDYTPEHSEWFEVVESKNATEIKMVTPAVVKNGALVLKGKIFTPKP